MSYERTDFTREFLTSNPQVAYALFQAMVMMNIVDPNIITVSLFETDAFFPICMLIILI